MATVSSWRIGAGVGAAVVLQFAFVDVCAHTHKHTHIQMEGKHFFFYPQNVPLELLYGQMQHFWSLLHAGKSLMCK